MYGCTKTDICIHKPGARCTDISHAQSISHQPRPCDNDTIFQISVPSSTLNPVHITYTKCRPMRKGGGLGSSKSTSRPRQSCQITHFIPIWGWSISVGPARLHYPQTSCEMAIMCVQACGGEWASVLAVSFYQPTMGLIYVAEYPAQVTKYKYTEIVSAHCSGKTDENKAWQELLRMFELDWMWGM